MYMLWCSEPLIHIINVAALYQRYHKSHNNSINVHRGNIWHKINRNLPGTFHNLYKVWLSCPAYPGKQVLEINYWLVIITFRCLRINCTKFLWAKYFIMKGLMENHWSIPWNKGIIWIKRSLSISGYTQTY